MFKGGSLEPIEPCLDPPLIMGRGRCRNVEEKVEWASQTNKCSKHFVRTTKKIADQKITKKNKTLASTKRGGGYCPL